MRLQHVSCHTEEHIGKGGYQEDAQRQGSCVQGVPQGPCVGPPVQQQQRSCQQVSPHIQGFVVSLEEAEEVAAPVLLDGTVARQDVGLSEQAGDLGGGNGGPG